MHENQWEVVETVEELVLRWTASKMVYAWRRGWSGEGFETRPGAVTSPLGHSDGHTAEPAA